MENNTALATVENTAPVLAQTIASNFEGSKKSTIYNALNNALSLSKDAPDTIELKGIICNPGVRAVSGDPCVNTYLVDSDGTAYFTQSTGISRCAQDLLTLYGGNLQGIVVKIAETEIGGGRTVKRLVIIDEPAV